MRSLGYVDMDLMKILDKFSRRFALYMKERGAFPHELGILLGYPVADVVGFMENGGKNFLYSGYWKVYSDLQGALDTFVQYRNAKDIVTHLVSGGMSINGILKLYQTGSNRFHLHNSVAV
jgi:hypothetical protein